MVVVALVVILLRAQRIKRHLVEDASQNGASGLLHLVLRFHQLAAAPSFLYGDRVETLRGTGRFS